jgi:hypothetical protein
MRTILSLVAALLLVSIAASAADKPAPTISASVIQVDLTGAGETLIPNEFRYAIYEQVVDHVERSNAFKAVYRTGDRRANGAPDMVTLRTTVGRFKEGSQTARELVKVMGWTAVDVNVVVTDKSGKTLLEQKVTGKVRFRGDNLKVTEDLGKRIAKLLQESVIVGK